jgi:hypothetical protein
MVAGRWLRQMETTMKRTVTGTMLGTILILGGLLSAAHADTWVFRDTLRPNGRDRTMAAKQADGRKCGASHNSFKDGSPFQQCMLSYGWALDHIIPDPPSAHARRFVSHDSAPIDNSSSDDWVARQRDQDNNQQMLNNQQMQNDQQFQQQQQQMIDNMNR